VKVTLWVNLLCLTSGFKIDEGVVHDKVFLPKLEIKPGITPPLPAAPLPPNFYCEKLLVILVTND